MVPGLLVVLIGYLGCDIIFVLIIWFIAVTLITAGYAGAMANIVDIAPNFAGEYFHIFFSFPLESSSLTNRYFIFRTSAGICTNNSYDRQFPISYSSWSAHRGKRKKYFASFLILSIYQTDVKYEKYSLLTKIYF